MSSRVLVTGASGQDGYYLIDLLLKQGYEVHAQARHLPSSGHHHNGVQWHVGDPANESFLEKLVAGVRPAEIYNLAAVSRPALSWEIPEETALLNAIVPQRICELIVAHAPECRLFQASSSEIFGNTGAEMQNEETTCVPNTPYGVSKLYAHRMVGAYRAQYGLHACVGILFNHESPRRALSFVSQKIAYAAAAVSLGLTDTPERDEQGQSILSGGKVRLGDISVRRDFGFAGDFAKAMQLILRHVTPDDYVIGTGQAHSIEEFCNAAFRLIGRNWRDHVSIDPSLVRKTDSYFCRADISKMQSVFRWQPTVSFENLVSMMVSAQVDLIKAGPAQGERSGVADG